MKENDNGKNSDSSKKWRWGLIVASIAVLLAMNTEIGLHHKPNRCNKDSCKFTGMVEDCCCDYETVNSLNSEVLHPLLQELVTTPFFRYFKAAAYPGWSGIIVATPYAFLIRFIKARVPSDEKMEHMAFYIAENGLMWYPAVVSFFHSLTAAAAVYAAMHTLDRTLACTETLKHYIRL
ncbi:hypothetical protein Cgig2_003521 [Carnegiea gigantea]|uniref:Cyclin C-terminal domain-containing protein n=1 Tax=Carnegiea gigantea TaxID=171969 RepID=A0A9Q1JL29_9CARY|nr:hypothetical protein Cgig2_003521 [Carnegiea gigantea]